MCAPARRAGPRRFRSSRKAPFRVERMRRRRDRYQPRERVLGVGVVLTHDDVDERGHADVRRARRIGSRENRVRDRADERELRIGETFGRTRSARDARPRGHRLVRKQSQRAGGTERAQEITPFHEQRGER